MFSSKQSLLEAVGYRCCPWRLCFKAGSATFQREGWWSSKHKACLPAGSIPTSLSKDRVANTSAVQPNTWTVGRIKKPLFGVQLHGDGSLGGDRGCSSPGCRTQGNWKSRLFPETRLQDCWQTTSWFLFGAAGNLVSSRLLCHYKISCTVFVSSNIQTHALIRLLSLLWAQR